jgi:hypothetical protein
MLDLLKTNAKSLLLATSHWKIVASCWS